MRLTKRGEYALRTMIRLGVAERNGEGVISVSTLAEQERLPFKFLEAILFELRTAGYVESLRGKYGGARLAQPMTNIKMGDIVRLIDGKLVSPDHVVRMGRNLATATQLAEAALQRL